MIATLASIRSGVYEATLRRLDPAVEVVAELDWLTHQGGFVLYPVLGIVAPEAAERLRPGPPR